tara:strand:+ start:729 stop:974 length:246 start_codon:yes stop_codon:yes gene_type:complete
MFVEFPVKLNEFRDYVHMFYGKDGVYDLGCSIPDIQSAIMEYMTRLVIVENGMTWGDGDSLDRERVRTILESNGFLEEREI